MHIAPSTASILLLPFVTGLVTVAACAPVEDDAFSSGSGRAETVPALEARVLDSMPTVVEVDWPADAPTDGYVEYGPDQDYGRVARVGDDGAVLLLGLPEASDVHLRAVWPGEIDSGEADAVGADQVVTTGAYEVVGLPRLNVDTDDGSAWGEFMLMPLYNGQTRGTDLVIYDREGRVVWHVDAPGLVERAAFAADGSGVLWLNDGHFAEDLGGVWQVGWRGDDVRHRVAAPLSHHDFVQLDDGRLAVIESVVEQLSGQDVVGDAIREYDRDGVGQTIWSAFDDIVPAADGHWDAPSSVSYLGADWTHANGLAYDPGLDRYALSSYWLEQVFFIDRPTGSLHSRLGGHDSDYDLGSAPGFGAQHAPWFTDDGLWLFDNHLDDDDGVPGSRVVRYELDEDAWTATPRMSAVLPAEGRYLVGGDLVPLADGGVFVLAPDHRATVYDRDGVMRWHATPSPETRMAWRGDVAQVLPPVVGD